MSEEVSLHSLISTDNKVKPFVVKTVLKEIVVRRPRLTKKNENGQTRASDHKKIK